MCPSSPASLCRDCSSRAINNTPYCLAHQEKNNASESKTLFDRYRADDPVRKLYRVPRWQGTRNVVLGRDILCKMCGHKASTDVDHIISARVVLQEFGLSEFYNPTRCQGLCHKCHSAKTAIECGFAGSKGTAIAQEELGDCTNITVVCGLPGSGKTYYVSTHKQPDDMVFDYDVQMAVSTGKDMHEGVDGAVKSILAQRDAFIRDAIWSRRKAWVIISRVDALLTKRLRNAGAAVIDLQVDTQVRLQRLLDRRPTGPCGGSTVVPLSVRPVWG